MNKNPSTEKLNELIKSYEEGDLYKAEKISLSLSKSYPNHPLSWKILGIIYEKKKKYSNSIEANSNAIQLSPNDPDLYNNIADNYKKIGKLNEAINNYKKAIEIKKDYFISYYNLGSIYLKDGNLNDAEKYFYCTIDYKSDFIPSYVNLGITLNKANKNSDAEIVLKKGIKINSNIFELYFYLGGTLDTLGKIEESIYYYKKAADLKPDFFGTYSNLGNALHKLGNYNDAITNYKKSIKLNNKSPETLNNFGNLLRQLGNLNDAEKCLKNAVSLNPNYAKAYSNLGNVLKMKGKLNESIKAYEKAIKINPNLSQTEAYLLYQKKNICDFSATNRISKVCSTLGITTSSIGPFSALSWNDNSKEQLLRSKKYVSENFNNKNYLTDKNFKYNNKKIKIGYFSADFYDFPSMHLMIGLLEKHNRNIFEIYAFSYGLNNDDWMNKRVKSAVDKYVDIKNFSTKEIIEITRKNQIDIAVDENGFTQNARTELFERKLSPIQVNFLGYPGTSGAKFIDYIVADHIVIPDDQRQFYSESIIYLPHCYQPNDDKRKTSNKENTREDFNLPKNAFVFCCFNKTYKIGFLEFNIWMKILKKINNSVLWLLKTNVWAMQNLKLEAKKNGINPNRLIFAERINVADHLNRHKHADLFLDTFNYNAHTTASDALWSGLPVITKQGKQFAARVASSLLNSLDLNELITKNVGEYEKLILELASDKNKLQKIKKKLLNNKYKKPLFDTERYTKNFENGLQKTYENYLNGQKPKDINIIDNL